MTESVTRVIVGFFKPTGFGDVHYVNTTNRWLAVRTVMEQYDQGISAYLNDCQVSIMSRPSPEHRMATILEPI